MDAVWMLDDDLDLSQLRLADDKLKRGTWVRYFEEIEAMRDQHPEVSFAVGSVCGDPHIRPQAILATQLLDVTVNLRRFAGLTPTELYTCPDQDALFELPDYYYDHSRLGSEHLHRPFLWLGRTSEGTVRAETLAYLRAAAGITAGKTPTRPLLMSRNRGPRQPVTNLLRGGNAVFFDLDALFGHTYPAVNISGLTTRRSDMVGAALLARSGGTWVADFACPVLHEREESLDESVEPDDASGARYVLDRMAEEFFGVLLARAVMDGEAGEPLGSERLSTLARERAVQVVCRLQDAQVRCAEALATLDEALAGWMGQGPDILLALTQLRSAFLRLKRIELGGADEASQARWQVAVSETLLNPMGIETIVAFARDELTAIADQQRQTLVAILQGGRHV